MKTLNEPFSKLSMRRRYEVWFLRLGLANGGGAWWFRYLLASPGRGGCGNEPRRQPAQVWATWFPREGKPQTWIQGFPLQAVRLSRKGASPLLFELGENRIADNECRGRLEVDGHRNWLGLALPFFFPDGIEQQGLDRLFTHTAFGRHFFRRDHAG
jgi:hypothetical protein